MDVAVKCISLIIVDIWGFPKIVGFPSKSSHFYRDFHGISIIFTIHFGVSLFLETPILDMDGGRANMGKYLDIMHIHVATRKNPAETHIFGMDYDTQHVRWGDVGVCCT